jgi:hypothetical protein
LSRIARRQVVLKQVRFSFLLVIPPQIVFLHSLMALLQSTLQLLASAAGGETSTLHPSTSPAAIAMIVRPITPSSFFTIVSQLTPRPGRTHIHPVTRLSSDSEPR